MPNKAVRLLSAVTFSAAVFLYGAEKPKATPPPAAADPYAEVQPGDRFVIETPGGGGFGRRGE